MDSYLTRVIKQFEYYKSLGDKTFEQLTFDELKKEFAEGSNSISIIVKHMVGNMISRWTNFLIEDGEKEWRHRDLEFVDTYNSKEELITNWNKGWNCFFEALKRLNYSALGRITYI
jgi:plasmid replication initiation protein